MQGRRVVFAARGVVELESFDVQPPGQGEILVRTDVTLISPGTEGAGLMALPNNDQAFPKVVGYSNVGTVLEVGKDVEGVKQGDRVASRAAHASHICVGVDRIAQVPEGLGSAAATFSTLCATSLQGVRKARLELGESVLVIGQGIVGNLALQLARLQGGYPVIAADLSERRLQVSRQVGADSTIRIGDQDLVKTTRSIAGGDGARVVIEATGSPEPIVSAFKAAGWRGRVVLLGSTRGETKRVNFYRDVHKRGLTIIGAHNSVRPQEDSSPGYWPLSADVRLGLDLMAADRIHVEPLITTRVPHERSADAYRLVTEQQREALGILIDWERAE